MRSFISASVFLAAMAIPAQAENWAKVDASLSVDIESMITDAGGYTLFKTRETDSKGVVKYQHKEAIHCGNSKHFFRGMYAATATVNNRSDSDVAWADWKTNPREVYTIDRLYALKTLVCSKSKK